MAQEAFRGMDAEVERYMDVLERPPELQPTYQSAFYIPFPNVPNDVNLFSVQSFSTVLIRTHTPSFDLCPLRLLFRYLKNTYFCDMSN